MAERIVTEISEDFPKRFWPKVKKQRGGLRCWIWQGAKTSRGYGHLRNGLGQWIQAHCASYIMEVGPIPEGMDLDHTCRNRGCVNPEHLEPVTTQVNTLRGIGPTAENARKTHCKHGHPLEGDNLYVDPEGKRKCRACMERIQAERSAKFKGPKLPKPTKAQLRKDLKSGATAVALGAKYGVSDTCIRNWVKKYGLA